MPRTPKAFQRQVNGALLLKALAVAAVLAICLLAATRSSSARTQASTYADTQISKLQPEITSHSQGINAETGVKPDEPTTGEIFDAVAVTQNSKALEQGDAKTAALQTDTKEVSRQADEFKAAEVSLQAELEAERMLISRQAGFVQNLVYFNDPDVMAELGCPEMDFSEIPRNYTCFYQDPNTRYKRIAKDWRDEDTGCAAVFRPLPADFGRPWCVQNTPAINSKVENALQKVHASQTLHLGKTLLVGMLSGPNPTHQLNIHFYNIYSWMKENQIQMGDLELVVDCQEPARCMGPYGTGLARAFGTLRLLPQLPAVTMFDQVTFSMPVGFPFDIHKYELDKTLDCKFLELTWAVKQHYGIDPMQNADPKRIILATRKPDESRALSNAAELQTALQANGFNVSTITFGELTFKQQLLAVSNAAVLVGVTGSDLMNLVFLPISGSIVEIFPVAQGQQVFTPELWNLAHMVGKNHLKYVSPYNSTLMKDSEGNVIGDKPVHQTKATDVHVPGLVALIQAAALAANADNVVWNRMSIEPHSSGKGIKCWDRTIT